MTSISEHGFWLFYKGREYFLDYAHFPWFKKATVEQICHIELTHGTHLYWPDLDVDLTFDIIEHPERYPRVSRQPSTFSTSASASAGGSGRRD